MTNQQIGYLVIGAVVAFLLYRRWKSSGGTTPVLSHESSIWGVPGIPGHSWVTTRPVVVMVTKARSKAAGWGVVITAAVTLYAILSH